MDKKVVKQFMLREQIEKREDIFFYFLQRNNISFEKIVRLIIGKVCDLVFLFFENKRFFQKMKADLDLLIKIFFNKNFSILENFSF